MMEQIAVRAYGQYCSQETAPTYPSHFGARSAFSARVNSATMPALRRRPCAMISCVGAPTLAMRRAIPTRPECPL